MSRTVQQAQKKDRQKICRSGKSLLRAAIELTAFREKKVLHRPTNNMRLQLLSPLLVLYAAALGGAASSWGFDDATISVQGKGAGVGGGLKEKQAFHSHKTGS